jgi:RNA polymerase sigma factor (sigma-70 family)
MTAEELFAKNKRLVFHMLKIVRPYGGGYMKRDWIQVGMIGLWKACQSYKPELALFSTYACNCIENEIKMEIRKVNSLGRKLHDTISWEDIPEDTEDIGFHFNDEELTAKSLSDDEKILLNLKRYFNDSQIKTLCHVSFRRLRRIKKKLLAEVAVTSEEGI